MGEPGKAWEPEGAGWGSRVCPHMLPSAGVQVCEQHAIPGKHHSPFTKVWTVVTRISLQVVHILVLTCTCHWCLAISGGWKLRGLNLTFWNSLMVQRMRIRLPMLGTQVWSLVWEDPTGHGATVFMHHNYWSLCTLKPTRRNSWFHVLQLLKPVYLEPVLSKQEKPPREAWAPQWRVVPHSPQLEKAHAQQWRPSTAKNKKYPYFLLFD